MFQLEEGIEAVLCTLTKLTEFGRLEALSEIESQEIACIFEAVVDVLSTEGQSSFIKIFIDVVDISLQLSLDCLFLSVDVSGQPRDRIQEGESRVIVQSHQSSECRQDRVCDNLIMCEVAIVVSDGSR